MEQKKPNKDLRYLMSVNNHNYAKNLYESAVNDKLVQKYLPDNYGLSELEEAAGIAKYDREHHITEYHTEALKTARDIFGREEINRIMRNTEELSPLDRKIKEEYESLVEHINNLIGTKEIEIFVRPSEQELEQLRDVYIFDKIYDQSR